LRNLILIPVFALTACASASSDPDLSTPTRSVRVSMREEAIPRGREVSVEQTIRADVAQALIAAPPERAWEAMLGAYRALGLEVTGIDSARMAVVVQSQRIRSRFAGQALTRMFDCGYGPTGPLAGTYTLQLTIVGQVTSDERGTQMQTRVEANARDLSSTVPPVTCNSRGDLEQRILDEVVQRVGGG
jgi:hypothetical protein